MIAEVLFPVALDKTFYYRVDDSLKDLIKPGVRIYSSFSHRKKVLGYVISVKNDDEVVIDFDRELKKIDKVIDKESIFVVEKFINIANFMAGRWVSPIGMVLRDYLRYLPIKLNYTEKKFTQNILPTKKIIISSETDFLVEKIKKLREKNFCVVVFFPNIFSLEMFSKKIADIGLSFLKYSSEEKQSIRRKVAKDLFEGKLELILSTKGGCFLPFPPNTYFIVTDPMNSMYRQFEQHPYYITPFLLEKIADEFGFSMIYFSPSLSPFLYKKKEEGFELEINKKTQISNYEIRDIKEDDFQSDKFMLEVKENFENNKKILIISHSKYLANIVFCPKCGWIKRCENCGFAMKVESEEGEKNYFCSYCEKKYPYTNLCEKCREVLIEKGSGTSKIYETLVSKFPDKKILLVDGRILYSKSKFDYFMNDFTKKNYDLIVSTEILASTTVDVKFDLIYFIVYESDKTAEYSYPERFFEKIYILFSKLNPSGKLIIYTYNPESFIFNEIKNENYFLKEIEMRKKFNYPPYVYFYEIILFSKDKKVFKEKVNKMIDNIKNNTDVFGILDFRYEEKIKKVRGKNIYSHKSWIKVNDYKKIFDYLKEYSFNNKLEVDVIEK